MRDDFRCLVHHDEFEGELNFLGSDLTRYPLDLREMDMDAPHIIPQSLNHNIAPPSGIIQAVRVWDILESVGGLTREKREYLDGAGIHDPQNVLTLCSTLRARFHALKVWFTPVGFQLLHLYLHYSHLVSSIKIGPNRYSVGYYIRNNRIPAEITFSSDTEIPLPDPSLLAIHSLAARVARLSGAAEWMELISNPDEDEDIHPSRQADFELAVRNRLLLVPTN